MTARYSTLDEIAKILSYATKEVLESATGSEITYSPTVQKIHDIHLKPDIGCFVQFYGDYSGLFIMNFTGEASFELYKQAMIFMGLPEDELAVKHNSEEVVNFIGELVNQITGKVRQMIEKKYGLTSRSNQPKAIAISSAIKLSIATQLNRPKSRKLSFKTADLRSFYIEMSMEETEFIQLFSQDTERNREELDIDSMIKERTMETPGKPKDDSGLDIDAIMAESLGNP